MGVEEQLSKTRTPIAALTGIRAVAAVWVVLFHFRAELVTLLPALEPLTPFAAAGRLGVDLFFVLSGFILAFNYADRFRSFSAGDYGRFLWLRLARVYPVHLFTLAVLVVTVVGIRAIGMTANPPELYTVPALFTNLLMVNAWTGMELTWNYPAWSISAEWFAYLLFPLIALAFARFGVRTAPRALAGVLITLAVGLPLIDAASGREGVPLIRVGVEFLAGCFLFVLYRHTRRRGGLHAWVLPLSFVLVAALVWLSDARTLVVAPALVLVVWSAAQATGPLAGWLASRPMVFWGQVSFALYMTHAIVIFVLKHVVAPEDVAGSALVVRLAVLAGYLGTMAVVAVAAFLLVERPSREWLRLRLPRS